MSTFEEYQESVTISLENDARAIIEGDQYFGDRYACPQCLVEVARLQGMCHECHAEIEWTR